MATKKKSAKKASAKKVSARQHKKLMAAAERVGPKAAKKKTAKRRKALGRGMREISRTDEVLQILRRRRDKSATLGEIVKTLGHESFHQKFYGTTCLNLLARKIVKRRKVDGVYVYTLQKKSA